MNKCEHVQAQLAEGLAIKNEQLRHHLEHCQDCLNFSAELTQIRAVLNQPLTVQVPAPLNALVENRCRRELQRRNRKHSASPLQLFEHIKHLESGTVLLVVATIITLVFYTQFMLLPTRADVNQWNTFALFLGATILLQNVMMLLISPLLIFYYKRST